MNYSPIKTVILFSIIKTTSLTTLSISTLHLACPPSNDALATACFTLCGRAYKTIELFFPISQSTKNDIEKLSGAKVIAPINDTSTVKNYEDRKGHVLSFSGGLDSLAAKFLMPDNTHLVSMDFGGRFSRERKFFEKFDSHVISTNLTDTHLRSNSHLFMQIASILFEEHIKPKYHTFGSIMFTGNSLHNDINTNTFPFGTSLGPNSAYYVYGLSEVGTALVSLHYAPEMYSDALESVASPGENKKYKKQLLSKILSEKTGIPVTLKNFKAPNIKLHYGDRFSVDILTFYLIKYGGVELTEKMVEGIPAEVITTANTLSLTFMERMNQKLYEDFPEELRKGLYSKAADAHILPYTDSDFEELEMCQNVIKKYSRR